MKPHEMRLAEHQLRNSVHLKNLRLLTEDKSRFSRISEEEQKLIRMQIDCMARLDEVLVKRMRLHHIPV